MEPALLEKDGENELTFASFTVEKGGEAVVYDDDDPENAYAKIRYNETAPEVTLYVNYSAGTATIEETGGLDPEDPNTEKAKKYFTDNKLTGTYVTEREEADNSNTHWSIKVAEDGDIFLYFDGENTGASAVADAATPKKITFSHDDWFTSTDGETKTPLVFTFDTSNYYFAVAEPANTIYWKKGDTGESFSFSSAPHYYNETALKTYFKDFKGEYTLPDGSDWKVTVSDDGMTLSGEGAKNAFVDYMTRNSNGSVKAVYFTSPDWYNNKKVNYQTLQLSWTADSSSKTYNFFKVSKQLTFYNADGKVLKGFNANSYFMPATGMYAYGYFTDPVDGGDKGNKEDYIGRYALSDAYGTVYGEDIEGIGGWYIEIEGNGHVYLHAGDDKREAVATTGSTGPNRVTTMYVCVPGWYTDKTCAVPAWIKLTWNADTTAKTAKLYFTSEALAVYKPREADGATGNNAVAGRIPVLRFESSEVAEYAKSKLSATDESGAPLYAGVYHANDESGEIIKINPDGSVVLGIPKEGEEGYDECTPLYYELKDANWRIEGKESDVNSVVFSRPNWFDAKKKPADADRQTVTMTWSATNLQFTAEEKTCYEENSEDVVRAYTANTKYDLDAINEEAAAYFSQYVEGTYTLNDGSGWKIKVAQDAEDGNKWKIYTDFDGKGYVPVENPAPVFAYDKNHTSASTSTTNGEWGNNGRYLSTITVPVTGWYTDENCTREAIVTLNWKGGVTNPMDDHQFNVGNSDEKITGYALYRNIGGTVECKYMTGTFYSDTDRELGAAVLKKYAGTYQPTASEGKWWIVIGDDGMPVVHVTDSQNHEHEYRDVAMDITMDKKKNAANEYFGTITGVTDIKVVVPEWRTVETNDTLANIAKCAEQTFTLVDDAETGFAPYFTPSNTYIYADTNGGNPWGVVTKSSQPGYKKGLITKNYDNDRAYSDANKAAAKAYFAKHAGTYYIDDPTVDNLEDHKITVTEEGQIYWGDYVSGEAKLPADVAFDAIRDDNENGKVDNGENEPVPGTISVWLNGYTAKAYSTSTKDNYNDDTQRADLKWNDTNEWKSDDEIPNTAHKFKTVKSVTGYIAGTKTKVTFAADKYYERSEDGVDERFAADGTYETTDAEYKIVVKTDATGNITYTFYRPDRPDYEYPLRSFGSGDTAYLRGLIGKLKKVDVYLVVTKIPGEGFENFLFTAYEVGYNDLEGKQQTSSSAPTVVLPAMTRFTNYEATDDAAIKNFVVAHPGETAENGTAYSRLSLALHNIQNGDTLYLKDNVQIDFEAKLPDNVGEIIIDGQGHTITRSKNVIPSLVKNIGADPVLMDILADPRLDPEIVLTALEDEIEEVDLEEGGDATEEQHYTGAILQVGAGDTVTLKNVTIDGEGKWEFDQEKLTYEKELNKSYDVDVLDTTKYPLAGHPIRELSGNVVSTESLIKVAGGKLILDGVTLQNFFAGDGYDDDRHFIDFMSTHEGKLEVTGDGATFRKNASRSGVCIGNTDQCEINLNGCIMQDNYCYGGNGGLVVALEGTQVYMDDDTKIINNVAADTNGTFIQLHKKTDGSKDGDNKGDVYSRLHMNGGYIHNNTGLRGGSYGWGQTIYLYNGGAFEMNGGDICCNMGAGISSIYQQPSADELILKAGHIHNNTCSLTDEGVNWPLDIALMNLGTIGEDMVVEQNFVVGAAAILGGYASGDEYLTNNGEIHGNISVYSYFNNEGNVSTVVNNNLIEGDIRLENGSMVKNGEDGVITGNVTIRGSLTESAGESSLHNEGRIDGSIVIAENAHFYNSGEVYGDVTVKSGGTLEMNCNDKTHEPHGGTIHGNVTVYPDGLVYAEVTPTEIDGTLTLEYEDEDDLKRMMEVLEDSGISYTELVYKQHVHTVSIDEDGKITGGEWDETGEEPTSDYTCTDPWTKYYACKTCGKIVKDEEILAKGQHEFYKYSRTPATCEKGEIVAYRCLNCTAYDSSTKELKVQVSEPLGHDWVKRAYIRPTEYGTGHLYYVCERCNKVVEFEIDPVAGGHDGLFTFENEDGTLKEEGEITKAPACTEPGEITFKCTDGCEIEIKFELPAKGHKYPDPEGETDMTSYKLIDQKDSTCTTSGYDKYAPICETCKEVIDSYTYQVNRPKLGHQMSEWMNARKNEAGKWEVDETTKYLCTDERNEIRFCTREDCDDADRNIETRAGGESKHTWDPDDPTTCMICGYISHGHHIDYRLNGGTAPASLAEISGKAYKPGDTQNLWQPDDKPDDVNNGLKGGVWTKQTTTGQAVFVGWSEKDLHTEHPALEDKPDISLKVSSVTIPEDADAVVFAVWAMDKNQNGKADYYETHVSIVYDENGGTGTVPEPLADVLPEGSYPLETEPELKKGAAVFAGWSLTKWDEVIQKEITDPKNESDINVKIARSLVKSPFKVPDDASGEVRLYAVYAVDEDGDGKPDFSADALHVEYYINGGKVREGYTVVEDGDRKGMFYVCNDYHHPGEKADLLALEHGGMMIYRDKAVLLGWSAEPAEGLVTGYDEDGDKYVTDKIIKTTGEQETTQLIESVELTGATSNAKVYAVWATDENENSIADYKEDTLTHAYHRNEYLSDTGGTTLEGGQHLKIVDEESNPIPEPKRQNAILPGMAVELADNHYFGSADLVDRSGKVTGHYVQVGWSAYSHGACTSQREQDDWMIAGDKDGYTDPSDGKYYRIIVDSRFENAYALWAIDSDRDGNPDYGPEGPGPEGPSGGGNSGWTPPVVDKSELKKAIDEAGDLDPEDYTDGTWPEVEKALEDAKKVYDDPTATQKEVDDAKDALNGAMGGLDPKPGETVIQPPASGTGWVYDPETGDWYFFKDGHLVREYWVGWSDGASAWVNIWYYVDSDGKLLTGFHYLDNLKGGKDWYMLQTTNDDGCIGRMLDGWQWTYTDVGEGWFNPKYGVQGRCEYTDAWGAYDAATGLWTDGMAHIG